MVTQAKEVGCGPHHLGTTACQGLTSMAFGLGVKTIADP